MGEAELKEALQREMEVRMQTLWHRAETEVAARRHQVEAEIGQLRERADARLAEAIRTEHNALLGTARQQGAACCLRAETALAERLKQMAGMMLPEFCNKDRAGLWRRLLRELPEADWQLIRVHPADAALARQELPAAKVETVEELRGGLVAELDAGRIRIDNSLSGRLERCWPELLSKLMLELRALVDNDGAVESDDTA